MADAAEPGEVAAWLRLTREPGLSEAQQRLLLKHFGLPEAILNQPQRAIARVVGLAAAQALGRTVTPEIDGIVAQTNSWLSHPGRSILTLADPRYPSQLLREDAAPGMLFIDGALKRLQGPRVALIAPRAASADAIRTGTAFASSLCARGVGLLLHFGSALTASVLAAVLGRPGADLLVVMDRGLDRVAPAAHRPLARRVAEHGALVTEFAPGEELQRRLARQPRLLMAGLASAVLVIEAGLHSSELATAQLAGQWGQDVYAVPGSIHAPLARGCHRLIRDGAKLVETIDDVIQELPPAH